MPISYQILDEIDVVEVNFSGKVTVEDFQTYFRDSAADPRVRPDMHRLADTRQVTGFPDSDVVREVGRTLRDRPLDGSTRIAVIATSELGSGVAMMMAGYAGFGERARVFADESSAKHWLTGDR